MSCTDSRPRDRISLTITTRAAVFNDTLAATSEHAREFMVAGEDGGFTEAARRSRFVFYGGKEALAQAGHRQKQRKQMSSTRDSSFAVSSTPALRGWRC